MAEETENTESFIRTIYNKVNSVLGNDNQLFMMEFPGRGLNPADFEYSTVDRTSIVTKPYSVREREFRLTDDLFNVSKITGGPNGQKLSTVFDIIINNYVPKLSDYVNFAKDKTLLRHWLMEKKDFVRKDGSHITTSRIAFCEELMNAYLQKKLAWDTLKDTEFKAHRKRGMVNITTKDASGNEVTEEVEDPKLMLRAMDDYSSWLSANAMVKDEELNQSYNDVVVRGHLHEVMTFLGFLNASTTAEALESTKQFMRNSSRLSFDSSSKIYPVNLNPTNWFKALRPNFAPKDLTMAKEALAAQYQNKSKALADIKAQKAELELMNVNPAEVTAAEKVAAGLDEIARKAEADYIKAQTEGIFNAAKMAIKAMKAAGELAAGSPTALSPLFARTFKSLSPTTKDKNEKPFDETALKSIQDEVVAITNKLDDAVVARQKVVDLKSKIAMMKSHDFRSMLQKLDAKIGILTSDIEYLRPLVEGAISIGERESRDIQENDWNPDKLAKDKWVFAKMVEKHKDELIKSDTLVKKGDGTKVSGITITEEQVDDPKSTETPPKKITVKTIKEIAKDKLQDNIKAIYTKFETAFDKNEQMTSSGAVEKPLLPDTDLDISDLTFSDIIISSTDTKDTSAKMSASAATDSKEKLNLWAYSRERSSSQSSAQSAFESAAFSSSFECGFRVAKVTIDRGGWFNPTLLTMSKAFHRLANFNGGSGLTMKHIEDGTYGELAKNCLLPAFPIAFVIAKDITFKIKNSETLTKAYNANSSSNGSSGSSFGGFASSSASSSSSATASTGYTGTHGDSLYIRIPGPQIIGWYLQFTPKDESTPYEIQSNKEGTGAINMLTLDDETILTELRLRREQMEDKIRNEGNPFA